jgi:hypothetical protein
MSSPIEASNQETLLALVTSKDITREQSKQIMSFADPKLNIRLAQNPFADPLTLDELLEVSPTDPEWYKHDVFIKVGENPNISQETLWMFFNDKKLRKRIAYNPIITEKMALTLMKENSLAIDQDLAANPGISEKVFVNLFNKYKRKDEVVIRSLTMNPSLPEKIAVKLSAHPIHANNIMRYTRVAESIFFKVNITDKKKFETLSSMLSNPYVTDAFSFRIYEEHFDKETLTQIEENWMAHIFFTHQNLSKKIFYKVKENNHSRYFKLILANPSLPVELAEEIFSNPILSYHDLDNNPDYVDRYQIINSPNAKTDLDVFHYAIIRIKQNNASSAFIKRCLTTSTFAIIQQEACCNPKAEKEDIKVCVTHWINRVTSPTNVDADVKLVKIMLDKEKPVYEIFKEILEDDYATPIEGLPEEMVLQLLGMQ